MSWSLWMFLFSLLGCPKSGDGTSLQEQLEREVIAGREHIRLLEDKLSSCNDGTAPNELYPDLTQVFQGFEVEVVREGVATKLVVKTSQLFVDPLALQFRAEGTPILDMLSTALNLHKDYQVTVVGHTSDRPLPPKWATAYPSLLDWSVNLSQALVKRLVDEYGCEPSQFTVGGRGAYSPLESNDLETGRDTNQRLEIWIYPPAGEKPAEP